MTQRKRIERLESRVHLCQECQDGKNLPFHVIRPYYYTCNVDDHSNRPVLSLLIGIAVVRISHSDILTQFMDRGPIYPFGHAEIVFI